MEDEAELEAKAEAEKLKEAGRKLKERERKAREEEEARAKLEAEAAAEADRAKREAELKKLAGGSRTTPGSEWAKAQLQVRTTIAEWRQQSAPLTNLTPADFQSVLSLPKELHRELFECGQLAAHLLAAQHGGGGAETGVMSDEHRLQALCLLLSLDYSK